MNRENYLRFFAARLSSTLAITRHNKPRQLSAPVMSAGLL